MVRDEFAARILPIDTPVARRWGELVASIGTTVRTS
jgi:hypothetical protein